jgi:hypothetical protein
MPLVIFDLNILEGCRRWLMGALRLSDLPG